jgi:hypothetical protein
MEWHFGYNCRYYLPTLGKCRVLIDNYASRKDLLEQKWLSTQELLVYSRLSNEELVERIVSGEISARQQKDGKLKFIVLVAAQFDDCPLADAGGQCLYFEMHEGKRISCLIELPALRGEHPNLRDVPSQADITVFEGRVLKALGGNIQPGQPIEASVTTQWV